MLNSGPEYNFFLMANKLRRLLNLTNRDSEFFRHYSLIKSILAQETRTTAELQEVMMSSALRETYALKQHLQNMPKDVLASIMKWVYTPSNYKITPERRQIASNNLIAIARQHLPKEQKQLAATALSTEIENPISLLPKEVLEIILDKASAHQADTPAIPAVCHQFRAAYDRILKRRLNIENAEHREAAIVKQQSEIDYLLQNKEAILNDNEKVYCNKRITAMANEIIGTINIDKNGETDGEFLRKYHLEPWFAKLEKCSQVENLKISGRIFQAREAILNHINEGLIWSKINTYSSSLNCWSRHLTRFPTSLFTNPLLKAYWSELKSLSLEDNQLYVVPAELGKLPALELLNLDDNQLTELPENLNEKLLFDASLETRITKDEVLATQKTYKKPSTKSSLWST